MVYDLVFSLNIRNALNIAQTLKTCERNFRLIEYH